VKIAISGSAGIGKTTLASALAECRGCRLIEEGYDGLFDSDAGFIKSRSRLRREILSLLEMKNALEEEAEAFVADRCAVDLFNLWMSRGFGDDQELTGCLYQRCRRYVEKYDFVFVLPWSAIPLRQIGLPVNRRRAMNPWSQLYNHANVIGLLHQWLPSTRLVPIPFGLIELRERVAFACEQIDRRR
jgi:adenylate kinase family enzyme